MRGDELNTIEQHGCMTHNIAVGVAGSLNNEDLTRVIGVDELVGDDASIGVVGVSGRQSHDWETSVGQVNKFEVCLRRRRIWG